MSSTTSSSLSAQALEGNRLLALLPPDTRRRMLPAFALISCEMSHVLYEPDRTITHIYFPLTAVTSVLSEMDDGTTVEVATIGREGMVGLSVMLGDTTTFLRTIAQIPGTALSMRRDDFLRFVEDRQSGLQPLLLRYTQAQFSLLAQQSACNRLHNMEERCARWILMTQDRVGHDEFPLTQNSSRICWAPGEPASPSRRAFSPVPVSFGIPVGKSRYWIERGSKRRAVNVMA